MLVNTTYLSKSGPIRAFGETYVPLFSDAKEYIEIIARSI